MFELCFHLAVSNLSNCSTSKLVTNTIAMFLMALVEELETLRLVGK